MPEFYTVPEWSHRDQTALCPEFVEGELRPALPVYEEEL